MIRIIGKSNEQMIWETKKMAWLRKHVGADATDIYNTPGFSPNGCGPAGWMLDVVPDQLPGLPCWEAAGDWHDWLYYLGGDERARSRADRELRRLMRAFCPLRCRVAAIVAWWRMRNLSNVYYAFVHQFGVSFFNYS